MVDSEGEPFLVDGNAVIELLLDGQFIGKYGLQTGGRYHFEAVWSLFAKRCIMEWSIKSHVPLFFLWLAGFVMEEITMSFVPYPEEEGRKSDLLLQAVLLRAEGQEELAASRFAEAATLEERLAQRAEAEGDTPRALRSHFSNEVKRKI